MPIMKEATMKAVLKNGLIHPQEPLPDDWSEGMEVDVEKAFKHLEGDALEQWFAELEAIAARGDPEEDVRLEAILRENHQFEKELAQKKAGLI
jgi:capsid protein